jgi:hypothetical protein
MALLRRQTVPLGTLMVTWRLMHVQWDIQALRGNAAITSNCSQCRSSPLPPQNSIRNEDILHTGDQVSPTSQTVAGPRATRRALNVPSALIVAPGARHRLRRPAAHSGPCDGVPAMPTQRPLLPLQRLRLDACALP